MVTGLGDLITWEPSLGGLVAIHFREQRGTGLGKPASFLTLLGLDGARIQSVVHLRSPSFPGRTWHSRHPAERPTLSAIQMMVDLQGPIGH